MTGENQCRPRPGRRLPFSLPPREGEPFASYIERLAQDLAVSPATILTATGIGERASPFKLPRAYGVTLSSHKLESFAHATSLSVEQVRATLLIGLAGVAFETPPAVGPDQLLRWLYQRWVYVSASHFCPACLRERGGAWRLDWKLPWSYACVRHCCLLIGVCPSCGRRTGTGRPDRRSAPNYLAAIPQPGMCANPPCAGAGKTGRAARPCGYPLADASAVDLTDQPRILRAQQLLNVALAGHQVRVVGETVLTEEYFGAMRSLCALFLYAADRDALDEVSTALGDAFDTHATKRAGIDQERLLRIGAGEDGRRGPRTRCYGHAPQDPALMAAIAPTALRMLAAGSQEALAFEIAPLVARAAARNRDYASLIPRDFSFSPQLRYAYQANLASARAAGRSPRRLQGARAPGGNPKRLK